LLKERLSTFGPPRDGFGPVFSVFQRGDKYASECFDREAVGADNLDQFTELGGLLGFDLFGPFHQRLSGDMWILR
jgi:hypothetical protein